MDAFEKIERLGLIMHGVEGRDHVERHGLCRPIEVTEVGDDELDVPESPRGRLSPEEFEQLGTIAAGAR